MIQTALANLSATSHALVTLSPWTGYYFFPSWAYSFTCDAWDFYTQNTYATPQQMNILVRAALCLFQYVVLPMFYAYVWRSAPPQVNVYVPASSTAPVVVETSGPVSEEALDEVDKEILHILARSHATTRMILHCLRPSYPDLERNDVNSRLFRLMGENRVYNIPGSGTAPMWAPIKIKDQ